MKRLIIDIVVIIVGILIFKMCDHREYEVTETSDTIVVHDTLTIVAPQATESKSVGRYKARLPKAPQTAYSADSVPNKEIENTLDHFRDTKNMVDSVEVLAPYIERTYKDSLYEAVVSGYIDPQLKSITVYPRTNYIYQTITRKEYDKRKKYSLGVGVGYGYNGKDFSPYIGIGVSYKILEW